jgi:hypothetical protein
VGGRVPSPAMPVFARSSVWHPWLCSCAWLACSHADPTPCPPLPQHADKYAVFVCSKGKREYIQLLWLMLDPLGQLIPQSGECGCGCHCCMRLIVLPVLSRVVDCRCGALYHCSCMQASSLPFRLAMNFPCVPPSPFSPPCAVLPADWDARLTSTYPDTLTQAANKTALTALGCYDITKASQHTPSPSSAARLHCLLICTHSFVAAWESRNRSPWLLPSSPPLLLPSAAACAHPSGSTHDVPGRLHRWAPCSAAHSHRPAHAAQ